jgi:polyferredoxin
MECVGCTACIDACDHIMDSIGKPRGLVRYASENGIAGGTKLSYTGRMKFYSVLLVVLTGILATLLITRKDIDGTIVRTRGQLYQERGKDSLANLYSIKIINKTIKKMPVRLRLEGEAAQHGYIQLVGEDTIQLNDEDQANGSFFIVLSKEFANTTKTRVQVGLYDGDKRITTLGTNFMGPLGNF